MDDYVRVEYRDKVSLKTGKPEVSYSIHAVVGNTLFGVDTTDYAAYIGPENIPVGRAMWGEAQRTVELLIARYLALQPKTSAKVVQATKITSSTSQYVITSAPWPTRPPTARPTATSTPIPVPSSPTYWIASGDTHAEAGLYRTAIKDYDIAIQLAPDHAEAYYKRGLAYFNNLQYGEAISDYEKTIQLDPTYAKAYNKQGRVSEKSGKYQAAIKQYDIAIQLAPDYAEAYYNRGDVYAWLGEDERAKADLDRACSLDKQYC